MTRARVSVQIADWLAYTLSVIGALLVVGSIWMAVILTLERI